MAHAKPTVHITGEQKNNRLQRASTIQSVLQEAMTFTEPTFGNSALNVSSFLQISITILAVYSYGAVYLTPCNNSLLYNNKRNFSYLCCIIILIGAYKYRGLRDILYPLYVN